MKCFYHDDMDGRCAGALVAFYTQNYRKEDYIESNYSKPFDISSVEKGEHVYFVDLSFSEQEKKNMISLNWLNKNCKVIWLDHHTSSIKMCEKHEWMDTIEGRRSDEYSGAKLVWQYFYKKFNLTSPLIERVVNLVSDYDCWQYKLEPDTTYFKLGLETQYFDALDSIWKNLFGQNQIHVGQKGYEEIGKNTLNTILDKGRILKDYVDADNNRYRESYAFETEIAGLKCMAVNKKTNSWIFGKYIKEYPIVMVFAFDGEQYDYSIFAKEGNGTDCSVIAESYGGGGHTGAAGFTLKTNPFIKTGEWK